MRDGDVNARRGTPGRAARRCGNPPGPSPDRSELLPRGAERLSLGSAPPERQGPARRERIRVPRTPPGMEDSRLPHRRRKAAQPARDGWAWGKRPMNDPRLLEDKDIDSALLREATEKLNFI